MTSGDKQLLDPAEIRSALQDILKSSAFLHSPQLVAFLRFVVCALLKGETDNIKSYTIAVDALGRPETFDPRTDPIVRVEAGRLRRALARYYATDGKHSPVVIEMPLGSYVPSVRRRKPSGGEAAAATGLRDRLLDAPRAVVAGIAIVLLALAALAVIAAREAREAPNNTAALPSDQLLPIVFVAAFETRGASTVQAAEVESLRDKLRDALARFDEIEVSAKNAQPPTQLRVRNAYRLAGVADYHGDTVNLSLSLDDLDDGTVAWGQSFEMKAGDLQASSRDFVQQVAIRLALPYGVIYADRLADHRGALPFRCVLDAFEFRRTFNREGRAAADTCLAQLTTLYPGFADAFALRSLNALNRYYEGNGDAAALEQAVMLAQKAVDLKPQSARARQALTTALFARGDIGPALAEGETGVSLNPNDTMMLHSYGLLLLLSGQFEKGAVLMRRAATMSPVRPALFEFGLFLAAYMLGDEPGNVTQARLYTTNTYPLILLARTVIAARNGDTARAQASLKQLVTISPAWRVESRQRLQRYFHSPLIVERLMQDLKLAGLAAAD